MSRLYTLRIPMCFGQHVEDKMMVIEVEMTDDQADETRRGLSVALLRVPNWDAQFAEDAEHG